MPIAREALPFVVMAAALTALAAWYHPLAAIVPALLLLFVVWFFRDPRRTPPEDPGALISPADGKIIRAGGGTISIFMNVFNVHVCRSPVAGIVRSTQHSPGRFMAAFKEEAPLANERVAIRLDAGASSLEFTLIAGLIARRIVCKVRQGQELARGERVGLIRFGSRVDVALPEGARPSVAVGDHVRAGESVIARQG